MKRAGKRRRGEVGITTSAADRISHLPEPILYQILWFLDTKSAVQTSVLSRAWRCAWKHVSVLNFRSDSFREYSSFQRYLDKVVSLRYPLSLSRVSYIDCEESLDLDLTLFNKVVQYALAHDTQHLVIDLETDHIDITYAYRFSDLFRGISNCNLKTLELRYVTLDSGFRLFGFGMLTTLILGECQLISDVDDVFFSNCPSLTNLVMNNCVDNYFGEEEGLKISGPQLLSLALDSTACSNMEVFGPRLKFLRVANDSYFCQEFSKLSVPSLDQAEIWVDMSGFGLEHIDKKYVAQCFISLFQHLSNVVSLMLDFRTIKVLSYVSEFLEQQPQQPSPFTRLQSLIVKGVDTVPYILINYFLKGSSCKNPNVVIRGTSLSFRHRF